MTFRRSGPALLVTASAFTILVLTVVSLVLTARLLEASHDGDYQLMRQVLASIQKSTEDRALVRAELVASMPAVRAAFVARDRPKLLAELHKMYEVQEQKYGLDQAQFHLPPGVSFLRLHKPEAFGDDQTAYRPMLADAHQTQMIRKGTALTKAGPAVFGIVPVLDDAGKFVGTFEMGLELAPMFDKMKEAYGLEAAVFFEEKQLRAISTDLGGEIMQPKNRVGKYMRYHATHPDLAAALVTDADVDVTEPKTYERTVAGTPWGVQLVPLYNYANKQIGVVSLATSFGEDKRLATRARIWQILAALFAAVGMTGVVFVVVRGAVLGPVEALAERMAALAGGDTSKPAEGFEPCCDEIRALAESYESLRTGRRS